MSHLGESSIREYRLQYVEALEHTTVPQGTVNLFRDDKDWTTGETVTSCCAIGVGLRRMFGIKTEAEWNGNPTCGEKYELFFHRLDIPYYSDDYEAVTPPWIWRRNDSDHKTFKQIAAQLREKWDLPK